MNLIDSHTVTFSKYARGPKTLITYGSPPSASLYTSLPFSAPLLPIDSTWSLKLQEVKLSTLTLFSSTALIDAVLVNSFYGFQYQTKSAELAQRVQSFIGANFGATTHLDKGKVSAMFPGVTCAQVRQSLTVEGPILSLVTQYDTGHTFAFDSSKMLQDSPDGQPTCYLAFSVLVDDRYSMDRIILGSAFLQTYNVSMNFDAQTIGIQGKLQPPPSTPEYKKASALAIIIIVLSCLTALGAGAYYYVRRKRRLAAELESRNELL